MGGQPEGQFGIQHRPVGNDHGRHDAFLLALAGRDDGNRRHFGTGSRRGRNKDQRQARPDGQPHAVHLVEPLVPWQQQRDQLGDVHGASAAQPDHALRTAGARGIDRGVDHAFGRIGLDFVIDLERHASLAQAALCSGQKPRAANTLIGHDEHGLATQAAGELAHPARSPACDQRRSRRLEFEVHDVPLNPLTCITEL